LSKQILIVGGTGFLGNALINKLSRNRGNNITCVYSSKKKIINKKSKVKYLHCDISKLKNIKRKLNKNFDIVINFAGYVDHKKKIKTVNSHFNGCKNLANHFSGKKIKLFIQIGSSLEYGNRPSPHYENKNVKISNLKSYYSISKLMATKYLNTLSIKKNINVCVLRPYLVYGPGQDFNRLIPTVMRSAIKNEIFDCSSGNQFRDFLYIDDFTDLIIKIIKSKGIKFQIFNVGYGKPVKVRNIISSIMKLAKGGKPNFGIIKNRPDELFISYPSIQKVKKYFNWKPKVSLKKGLKKTYKFFKYNVQ
jgi:nucleoside-diphosphate-sugar epimerase